MAYVLQLAEAGISEMRALIFELRPESLEQEGLVAALEKHAASLRARYQLEVAVDLCGEPDVPLPAKEALYRIAQEALHNVVKHANATRARIGLRRVGRQLRLVIEDNGIGFDPLAIPRGHLGVVGMQQRAERIGAALEIGRRPGGGSRVRVSLALRAVTRRTAAVPAAVVATTAE